MLNLICYEEIATKEKWMIDQNFWIEHPGYFKRMRKCELFPNLLDEIQLIPLASKETFFVDLVFQRQWIRFTKFQQGQYQYQFLIANKKELLYVDTTPTGIDMFNVLLYTIDCKADEFEKALAIGAEMISIYLPMCYCIEHNSSSIRSGIHKEIRVSETFMTLI